MINARRHVGAVALNGCLYAVGGHSGTEHLASVECFDLKTKRWQLRRQMNTPRRGIALAGKLIYFKLKQLKFNLSLIYFLSC